MTASSLLLAKSKDHLSMATMGVVLLFLSAQVSIKVGLVPFTLQTAALTLIGLTFTTRGAVLAVMAYVLLGAMGAPVFAEFSGGLPVLFRPTGGYILAFLPAVYGMAVLSHMWRGARSAVMRDGAIAALGLGIVFVGGVSWLTRFVGFDQALAVGFYPFILSGALKGLLTAFCVHFVRQKRG